MRKEGLRSARARARGMDGACSEYLTSAGHARTTRKRERHTRQRNHPFRTRGRTGNHGREPNLTTTARANQTFSICSSITHYGGGALIAAPASNSTLRHRHSPSGETIRIIRRSDKEGAERREGIESARWQAIRRRRRRGSIPEIVCPQPRSQSHKRRPVAGRGPSNIYR